MIENDKKLILGSSSASRKQLLAKFNLDFEIISPDINETRLPGESCLEMIDRLSLQKALAVASKCKSGVIVAGDHILEMQGELIGKPGDFAGGVSQLKFCRGKSGKFYTGLVVYNVVSKVCQAKTIVGDIRFRNLADETINSYLLKDKPWGCAGSISVEDNGFTLLESINCSDPYAILGLPLLSLTGMLSQKGFCFY